MRHPLKDTGQLPVSIDPAVQIAEEVNGSRQCEERPYLCCRVSRRCGAAMGIAERCSAQRPESRHRSLSRRAHVDSAQGWSSSSVIAFRGFSH
jgi:hypothetical protein